MPTYDFACQECESPFEVRMSMTAYSEGPKPPCPRCGSKRVERTFTAVNVLSSNRGLGTSGSGSGCGRGGFT